jgi:hypothetical protein
MKKIFFSFSILIGVLFIQSCNKSDVSEASISNEDLQQYEQMRLFYNKAVLFEDTLEKCQDSIIINCNFTTHDSLFHYCIDQWEYHHGMYTHNNNIDDHHHNMMMGEHHEHCQHCDDIEHHTIEEHYEIDSLLSVHSNYFH